MPKTTTNGVGVRPNELNFKGHDATLPPWFQLQALGDGRAVLCLTCSALEVSCPNTVTIASDHV